MPGDRLRDGGEDSPWADGPLVGNASGSFIYFAMVWSRAEDASTYAARVAEPQAAALPAMGVCPCSVSHRPLRSQSRTDSGVAGVAFVLSGGQPRGPGSYRALLVVGIVQS